MNADSQLAPHTPPPRSEFVKNWFYQNAILMETPRAKQLDRYMAHYECRQYAHLQMDWWGMSADQMETVSPNIQVPLGWVQPQMEMGVRTKRPTAPYNLCRAVVDRFTGLLLSDVRRPTVAWEGDPDTESFMLEVMNQSLFWPKMRQARGMGGATGSVVVTAHLRDGKFSIEVHNPMHCQVMWKDKRSLIPEALLVCYRFIVMEPSYDERTRELRSMRPVEYLYRRLITEIDDTVFKPAKLEPGQGTPWEVESTVVHNLGYFPGSWIQNLPALDAEDGIPDCHGAWQNFDTIDRLLSQMNKAVLLNMDPTAVIAVDPKTVEMMGGSVRKGSENALYVGVGGSANYMEITGSGVAAGEKVYDVLKKNALDVVRCVMADPEKISGAAQSAKAIEYLFAPMLEKADDLRAQYGDLGIVPFVSIMERMARTVEGKEVVLEGGRKGVMRLRLPPKPDGKPHTLGKGGYIRLTWGPYFSPTENDKQLAIGNAVAAQTGGAIDNETKIKAVAPLFGIRDVAELQTKIESEQKANDANMMGPMGEEDPYGAPAGAGGLP